MPLNFTCPYECEYTFNRSLDMDASARLFHARDFDHDNLPAENSNALNVYFTLESAKHSNFRNPSFSNNYRWV